MGLRLLWIFLKFGLFCFGGGNAMISVFEKALVQDLGFLGEEQFVNMVAISQITPGPVAVNLATYVGAVLGDSVAQSIFYAFMATFGISIPAFVLVVIIAKFFATFGDSPIVVKVMKGIKPGVIGLILGSVLLLCHLSLYDADILRTGNILGAFNWKAVGLAVAAFVLCIKTKINPVAILIGSGIAGIFIL